MKHEREFRTRTNALVQAIAIALFLFSSASFGSAPSDGESAKIRIVTFGTSLTAKGGWQQSLASTLQDCLKREVEILNLAKSGANSAWGVRNIDRVIEAEPDVVLIEFSINDAALHRGVSLSNSQSNIREIVHRIQTALPRVRIYLMTMSPVRGLRGFIRPRLKQYYEVYRHLSIELPVGFIDNRPIWARLSEDQIKKAIPDGAHPDPSVAAALLVPPIAEAIADGSCRPY